VRTTLAKAAVATTTAALAVTLTGPAAQADSNGRSHGNKHRPGHGHHAAKDSHRKHKARHHDRDRDRDEDSRRHRVDRLPERQTRTKTVVVTADVDSRTDRDKFEREQVSFEQYQSWMLAGIDSTLGWLTKIEQRFADRGMDGKVAWIQRKQETLTDLRGKVEAATNAEEIRAAVRDTREQVGTLHGLGFGHAKAHQPS
jgi:hypothetical protein